ncbi:hypothetical protein M9H77_06894 [Catharanthus roseus]|uniref:Uncharacterized protein n=1 Tax=Catharanthus roseus TaxID=4058 RepID=A0ACC0BTL9_CATRO|nr:hypothetical protein M9H77_06894 [Catharanthus roseus]
MEKLPQKLEDPGCFSFSCVIGSSLVERALADLGTSINVMSDVLCKRLAEEIKEKGEDFFPQLEGGFDEIDARSVHREGKDQEYSDSHDSGGENRIAKDRIGQPTLKIKRPFSKPDDQHRKPDDWFLCKRGE